MGRLCFSTYAADMKEYDALESNNTTTEVSLMRNMPIPHPELLGLPS
jgi:hypothetical protein